MTKRVEINYVVETETAINIMQEENQAEAHDIRLINKSAFVSKCNDWFGDHNPINYYQLWDRLIGNYPNSGNSGIHPQVHYLTEESCEIILQHIHQFDKSGMDYQNLPAGFFLVRNPLEGGGRDVLHFSEFLAKNATLKNCLAISLTDKDSCQKQLKAHLSFESPKNQWYQFLVNLANKGTGLYPCTQKQLDDAFIHFANELEARDLQFFDPDFSNLKDANPIVLLGRWHTVLFNRQLKPDDRQAQWRVLPQLPLEHSYGAIRAITDHMHTKSPCGFLLPEMALNNTQGHSIIGQAKEYKGYNTVATDKNIQDEMSFWRYVAFQPKRSSIDFYRRAIALFPEGIDKSKLYSMLAAATTGDNHLANNAEQESKELEIWAGVCDLVDRIESISTVIQSFIALQGAQGLLRRDFLYHLTRLEKQPNIPFLSVMAKHISDFISKLGPMALAKIATGHSPLEDLVQLSDKLNACVSRHGNTFYRGCQFYLVDGQWHAMSTKTYTELAYEITYNVKKELAAVIIPLISTFGITHIDQLGEINNAFTFNSELVKKLTFFSTIFQDVQKPLDVEQLRQIVTELTKTSYNNNPLAMLAYFEEKFADYFAEEYFDKKRKRLEDATNGLNQQQIALLEEYQFDDHDLDLLIQIESAMVRKQPFLDNETLIRLNEQFSSLTDILMPSDFTEFLTRLASLRDCMPEDDSQVTTLLNEVIKQKSLTSFNVIFLRNKIEKIKDDSLLPKINKYIALEKHITTKNWSVNPIYLQETLATLILKLPASILKSESVDKQLTTIIDKLNMVASLHPHAQQQTINLINNVVQGTGNYFEDVSKLLTNLDALTKLLPPGTDKQHRDNMSVFYSLVSHYQTEPLDLIKLLDTLNGLKPEQQSFFLVFVTRLLNSDHSLTYFEELVERCRGDEGKMSLLETHCAVPPYATIEQLCNWLDSDNFETAYNQFCLSPYQKRHQSYMFDKQHYDSQKNRFKGVSEELFTDELGNQLDSLLRKNRSKSMFALRSEIEESRSKYELDENDMQKLLTATIEILARTAHQVDITSPTGKCSQELNTTQVMAAYAMLQKGRVDDRIINQVDTGEGKSRLMMVLSACQAIRGETVDFITSNMVLAERDYFAYQEFFNALEIPTGLINLNTPPQLYRKSGVNFSDNSNLILLRNKSDIDLLPTSYLDENKNNRCLMLDEEDKFIHDKSSHAFNFAAKSKSLAGFVWVYPLLVGFMQENQLALNLYKEDDALFNAFLRYVSLHDNDQLHQASLANLKNQNPKQLKVWLQSALTALSLKVDVDYSVTPADDDKLVPVRNIEGLTCYTRQVLVLDNGRPMEGSNYSDGVHQCICAIENQKAGKDAFVIMPENETQRTIYTLPFLNTYKHIYGVSGSTRADAPMANPDISLQDWQYMITPREKPLRREEKRVLAAKDETQQLQYIKDEIIEAVQNGQSFLLVCRSDEQSKFFIEVLKKDEKLQSIVRQWQHVHGLTSHDEEKQAVQMGGTPGFVTISSVGMFSRGVDIRAENLKVRASFVPTLEDEIQIKGRTGRFGKKGDYRMVVNLQDEETPIDGRTYNIEARVREAQYKMAVSASIEEKTASMYSEFLEKVHQEFLKHFAQTLPADRSKMLNQWQTFLDDMQKDWELKRQDIKEALDAEDLQGFKTRFNEFVVDWRNKMREKVVKDASLPMSLDLAEKSFGSIQAHRGFFAEQSKKQTIQPKIYYDKADDGQATIYQIPFAQTLATLRGERPLFANTRAWWDGRGVLFPDLRATLNGERPLFANLRAFISYLWELITNCFKKDEEEQAEVAPVGVTA